MNPSTWIASMAVAVASTIVLGGCASSLSGIGGTPSYACKAPIGAQCTSISGIYANANAGPNANNSDILASRTMHEALRPQGLLAMPSISIATHQTLPGSTGAAATVQASGAAAGGTALTTTPTLRSPPRVIRLWISPWEDADGDLHEVSLVHVVIDTGRWLIERVRPAPRSRIDIAIPPLSVLPVSTAGPETTPTADLVPIEP